MINIDYTESESRENSPKRHLASTPESVPVEEDEEDPSGESELDMSESGFMEKKTDIDSGAVLEINEDGSPIDLQRIKKNCLMLPRTLKMKKPGNTGEQSSENIQ